MAYNHGVIIVAAAGNRLGISPPSSMVWPARFGRVIAACGVNAGGQDPYYRRDNWTRMQGCFGPADAMTTAMAAYTPNIAWAEIRSTRLVDLDGAGTSSATPQIAAAAALWLRMHGAGLPRTWERVEAVRRALFGSAHLPAGMGKYIGRGILRADEALNLAPGQGGPPLKKTPMDQVWFPLIKVLVGLRKAPAATSAMLELEATQLVSRTPGLSELVDQGNGRASKERLRTVAGELADSPHASRQLREAMDAVYPRRSAPAPKAAPAKKKGRSTGAKRVGPAWTPSKKKSKHKRPPKRASAARGARGAR
jgi:subtilase family protein